MAWSGGSFSRALGANQWANDAAANVGIEAGIHDTQDNDLATGINACLNKNGQNSPTVDISMGGFKFTNVGNATARTNFISAGQIQDGSVVHCGVATGTANAIVLTPTPALAANTTGIKLRFVASATCTGATTINASGLGALPVISLGSGADLTAGEITDDTVYEVVNFGAFWWLLNPTSGAWTSFTTTHSGFSVNPTYTMLYKKEGRTVHLSYNVVSLGTSNDIGYTITIPFTAATRAGHEWTASLNYAFDNSAATTGFVAIPSGGTTAILYNTNALNWTGGGTKGAKLSLTYEAAA